MNWTSLFKAVPVIMAGLATVSIFSSRGSFVPEQDIPNRPVQLSADGYVTSSACQACHPREYHTWHDSYHRTMTQVPTPDNVIPSFDDIQIDAVQGQPMLLQRRGGEFWAEFDDPDFRGKNGETRRITRPIVLLTGSHQQQAYWYATGVHRLISKLPAMYLIREKQWIPRRAAFLHPPDEPRGSETGGWNGICIACHTTDGKPQIDSPLGSKPVMRQVAESTVSEFGIACEACHGPGEEHIRANRNPARRYWLHLTGGADPTIVHPLRLNAEKSSQVCGQCHSVWEFYDLSGEREANQYGLSYRPGAELRDSRFLVQPTINYNASTMKEILAEDPSFLDDSFWPDGMVRVSGREYNGLIESPCFKGARKSGPTMSCFSCHNLHKPEDDPRTVGEWADRHQLAAGMDGNEACLQCHREFRTNLQAHTKHVGIAGNLCYNCHMPYTSYGLLRALRSHQVSSPSVAITLSTGRPDACNLCHLDQTLGWTSEYLAKWYDTPKPHLSSEEETTSTALLWLLRGDAGQRALIAWSMGWRPAQQASGADWMPPFLGQLLDDPYDAIRLIAARSLHSFAGFEDFKFDFLEPGEARTQAVARVLASWRSTSRSDARVLLRAGGKVDIDRLTALKLRRNDRRMFMRE